MRLRTQNCAARRSPIGLVVASVLAALTSSRARAVDADSVSGEPLIEEVVVTARKRQENLQDIPLSVNVLTNRDLQRLNISGFDEYAQKVPSISFVSAGPGTQILVMRGASDGSTPSGGNTSSTGFFVDDMSMTLNGAQPDLHLYDIERIEVLQGPQGTTFGAGAMSGAVRYITNKPDLTAFSAGIDLDGGKIQGGGDNQTYEMFVNVPVVEGIFGLRLSAFSANRGGFINNQLTTRAWINGVVSDNAAWARNNYNREHVEGGRIALKAVIHENWSAELIYGYQRQHTSGAWDQDPDLPKRTVARFGPETNDFEAKMLNLHVDGDIGIADLVFASTYWSQPRRQWNEYSEYEENYNSGSQQGLSCLNDPVYGTGPYEGCNPPLQFYSSFLNPERWSNELRLLSKPGGRFHWLVGYYREKTRNKYTDLKFYLPGLQYQGAAFQSYLSTYGLTEATLPPTEWLSSRIRSDRLQTTEFANISFDLTDRLNIEAGAVHFDSDFSSYAPRVQFAYYNSEPSTDSGSSDKWTGKFGINYKVTDKVLAYADFAQGFRDGGTNAGLPQVCFDNGVPQKYSPDTLNNYELGLKTTSPDGRLLWNSAAYWMEWQDLQTSLYDFEVCPPNTYHINIGNARIYGAESNASYLVNDKLSLQASASYTDARVVSTPQSTYQQYVGERLSFAPYFSWSWNARYEQPLGSRLLGYAQFDMAHKGSMWNGISPHDHTIGLPRILQPAYSLMNLRFGLTPAGRHWLAELYITNLADKNAIVYSNTGNYDLRLTTNEPRVYGIRVNYRFDKGQPR